jgi:uncharacterized protein YndB with AHSA1/START domain
MVKKTGLAIVMLIAAVLIIAATRPGSFHVQRAIVIKAPPEKVFALINDFRKWESWSPWERMDPAMTRTLSGAAAGRGAVYEWEGNGDVGQGRMEITDAVAPSRIAIGIDFLKPMEAHNTIDFVLARNEGSTNVTWSMHGTHSFVGKLFSLFMSMDAMVGGDFEKGLANMKAAAEK